MSGINFRLTDVDLVQIIPKEKYLEVDLEGVDVDQLLDNITLEDIFDHFGDEAVEYAKDNHNLTEAEE